MTAPSAPAGDNVTQVTTAVEAALAAGATAAAVAQTLKTLAGVTTDVFSALMHGGFAAKLAAVVTAQGPTPGGTGPAADVARAASRQQAAARAAYLATGTVRLAKAYATGDAATITAAEERESTLYDAHIAAAEHRDARTAHLQEAVKGATPDARGRIMLGWHADDNPNRCARCTAADGKNFDALDPPAIGWPGWVHPHCYCLPGVPFPDGGSVNDVSPNLRDVSGLQFGRGSKLWEYWVGPKGTARYIGNPHPWTALRDALIKEGVPVTQADGLATNIMMATPAGRAAFKAHHSGTGRGDATMTETRCADAATAIREFRAPTADDPAKPHGFTARAVNYGVADSYNTSWQRGVFAESLAKRMPSVVWGHDRNDPIGRVIGYRDTDAGLDIDVELDDFDAVPRAKQAYAQLKSGTMDQFSFAFKRAEEEPDPAIRGCTRITKAAVDEFSVVLVGAVPDTHLTGVRSADTLRVVSGQLAGLALGNRADWEEAVASAIGTLQGLLEAAPDGALGEDAAPDAGEDAGVLRMAQAAADDERAAALASPLHVRSPRHGLRAAPAPKKPYGDVAYADPGYQSDKKKRYPLDTKAHVQAALTYIAQDRNAQQYSAGDLAKVKSAIAAAAKRFGIETAAK